MLCRCPFAEVAATDPGIVCQLHLGLAEGVAVALGEGGSGELVARDARPGLDAPARMAFFRAVGQRYAFVDTGALLVAIAAHGDHPAAEAVRRGRVLASALRGTMVLMTLAIVVLAAQAVTD